MLQSKKPKSAAMSTQEKQENNTEATFIVGREEEERLQKIKKVLNNASHIS